MIKFSHYSSLYLEFKEHELKPSTYEKYKNIVSARISPFFSELDIATIKPSDVKKWLYNINDVGNKSKRHYLGVLSGIFQEAFFDEVIPKNPVKMVKLPNYNKPLIRPFTTYEVQQIMNYAKYENYRYFLAIAFYTGLRSGETIALKKTDIDLKNNLISVRRTRSRFGEGTPKTKQSVRDVPILDVLKPYLVELLEKNDHDYLFVTRYNKPYVDSKTFTNKFWKPALTELKIPYRRPYNTRHTYATNMLYNNLVTPVQLAQLLGHANTEMVYNVYVRYLDSGLDNFDTSIKLYV
jgi:integrase